MAATVQSITHLRRRTLLAAAIAVIGLGGAVSACASSDPVDLKVVDRETGQTLPVWRHDGRLFVAGQPGDRYSLRVTNHTNGRVLVVMSVDGVNILSGDTADYDQDGYVFDPHESYDLTGWRKSLTEVAAFTFAPLPDSYAARTGRPQDVGVIGIAVFKEKRIPVAVESITSPMADESARRAIPSPIVAPQDIPAPSPPPAAQGAASPSDDTVVVTAERRAQALSEDSASAAAMSRDDKLGTAHGDREESVTTEVPFERATQYPIFVRRIEYDTYDNLVASGVIPAWRRDDHEPRPFPGAGEGFVPDPPG